MTMTINFPKGEDIVAYLCSFSLRFSRDQRILNALNGMQDSFRQAELIPLEPIALFSCFTAEEEASSALYFSLRARGYQVPNFGKIRDHRQKIQSLIISLALVKYFFGPPTKDIGLVLHMKYSDRRQSIEGRFALGESQQVLIENWLHSVVTEGDPSSSQDAAIDAVVKGVVSEISGPDGNIASAIDKLARRRNLCIYGRPSEKWRLSSLSEIDKFKGNCAVITTLTFMILQDDGVIDGVNRVVSRMFDNLK